jgi:hypothetical protein
MLAFAAAVRTTGCAVAPSSAARAVDATELDVWRLLLATDE